MGRDREDGAVEQVRRYQVEEPRVEGGLCAECDGEDEVGRVMAGALSMARRWEPAWHLQSPCAWRGEGGFGGIAKGKRRKFERKR